MRRDEYRVDDSGWGWSRSGNEIAIVVPPIPKPQTPLEAILGEYVKTYDTWRGQYPDLSLIRKILADPRLRIEVAA